MYIHTSDLLTYAHDLPPPYGRTSACMLCFNASMSLGSFILLKIPGEVPDKHLSTAYLPWILLPVGMFLLFSPTTLFNSTCDAPDPKAPMAHCISTIGATAGKREHLI